MDKIREIADRADMIVNGYAFTRENGQIRVLNPSDEAGDCRLSLTNRGTYSVG